MVAARNVSLVCHAMCVSTVRGASSIESVMETGRGSRKSIAARAKRPVYLRSVQVLYFDVADFCRRWEKLN